MLVARGRERIDSFKAKNRFAGIALEASIAMLASDANEVELPDGMSVQRVGGLFRRGIRVSRVKYENHFPGARILFFSIPAKKLCLRDGGSWSGGTGRRKKLRLLEGALYPRTALLGI